MPKLQALIASNHKKFRRDLARCVQFLEPCIDVVREASRAEEALTVVHEDCPDLVLLDLSLRPGNALRLVAEMHQLSPATDVVVIGHEPSEGYREAALQAGALDYVHVLDLASRLPESLRQLDKLIECRGGVQQTEEWVIPDEIRQPLVVPARRRGLFRRLLRRMRNGSTGLKLGPVTLCRYVHFGLLLVLTELLVSLQREATLPVERGLYILLALGVITYAVRRQFAWAPRTRHARR